MPENTLEQKNRAKKILERQKIKEAVRKPYEDGLWKDISRFVNPRREDITISSMTLEKGRRRGKDVYDGTPSGALSTWADGMQGFMVSRAIRWFKSLLFPLELNDLAAVKAWLQEYDEAMREEFRRSNFYDVVPLWFRDAGSIGTATLFTEEDIAGRKSVITCVHPREVFISEDRYGFVDSVHRKFQKTNQQLIQIFTKAAFTDSFVTSAEKEPEKPQTIIHAVFPNDDIMLGKSTSKGSKFVSAYVLAGVAHMIRERGFKKNPYAVWRFRKNSDEIYGYSPAADAITEVFSLQQFGKTLVQAAQMSINPPRNVPIEMRGRVRMLPKGNNYYDDPQRVISTINAGINYPVGKDEREDVRRLLEDKYRVEFFKAFIGRQGEATATEILEIKSEQAMLMSPQVDQLTSEGLNRQFDIMSALADRNGRLPPPPEVVREFGERVDVENIGPLAQAQKRLFRMQPIRRGLEEISPIAAIRPEVLDRVNWNELSQEMLEASDFPQKLIFSDDQVKEIQDARAEKLAQQEALAAAGAMAEAVPKLSKDVEPDSPLAALVGSVTGGT
ncbi:hypothetical protein LCGC14_0538630 [marine sediment metagenome]|uniref:Bacteriophage head to tail connecting protein n=1 Tax=marine sediment metagenome TaxID=412755 RepID=A0A0F9V1Q1_9ZZZZ